ncbi:MAG: N-acetyl-gamma-glutamyl-phosphate reductase [Candidatus Methanodesulfokora sp.]|jgi:N-acetyl-gamma-glutamyl-phosphate/LysW-gamma-L-alpha-aminoadipyl-6-phosphate reductase
MRIRVGIIGASGYTGGELLRILANHPSAELTYATSREYAGKPLHYAHYNLRGYYKGLRFNEFKLDEATEKADLFFLSLPHGASLKYVPDLLSTGIKVIDLSADFRLKNPDAYKFWYGFEHPYPDLLSKAVYGLPEIHRDEIKNASLVASPGCNATATILALLPVAKAGLIDPSRIVSDVKVGSSEGGSKPRAGSHHPEREGAIRPYDAEGHRHAAEVEQELELITRAEVSISLVPHAVSSVRGALASVHSWLVREADEVEIMRAYVQTYSKEHFIRLVRAVPPGYPDPKYVIGSNYADVSYALEKRLRRLTAFAAIDNMMKGAAGQAVQAFNIMIGCQETLGLDYPPLKP